MLRKRIDKLLIFLSIILFFVDLRFFLISITLLFLFYLFTCPENCLIIILLLTFTESSPIFGVTFTKIGLLFLLALFLFNIKKFHYDPIFIPMIIISLLFLGWYFYLLDHTTLRWTVTIIGNIVFAFLLIELSYQDKKIFDTIIKGLFLAILLNSALAIYQFVSNGRTIHYFGINNDKGGFERWNNFIRVSGFFQNTNLLLSFLLPSSMIIIPFLKKRWGYLLILPFLSILFTFSRGGWIAIFVSFLLLSIFYNKKIFLVMIIITAIFLLAPFSQRFFKSDKVKSVYYSDIQRIESVKVAKRFISHNILIGIGPGKFYERFRKYASQKFLWNRFYPHNTFVSILCDIGIGGLISILSILIFSFFHTLKLEKQKVVFLSASLISLFLLSNLYDLHWEPQFWIIVAISVSARFYYGKKLKV